MGIGRVYRGIIRIIGRGNWWSRGRSHRPWAEVRIDRIRVRVRVRVVELRLVELVV